MRLARVVAAHLLQNGEHLLLITLGDASLKQWHQCVLVRLHPRRKPQRRGCVAVSVVGGKVFKSSTAECADEVRKIGSGTDVDQGMPDARRGRR